MATSSITKDFKVKNIDAFRQMINEDEKLPTRTVKIIKTSNIERGSKLLKQFSFR